MRGTSRARFAVLAGFTAIYAAIDDPPEWAYGLRTGWFGSAPKSF